jgi:putative membrane protein
MRPLPFAVAGCLVLAACGAPPEGPQAAAARADQAAAGPIASALAPAPSPQRSAQDFVSKAAASDAFELAAAREAQQRATNGDVKVFAAMMLRDHGKSSADLEAAVAAAGQTLSAAASPSAEQQAALAELGQADAAVFDRGYMTAQLKAHQAALSLLQDYAQNGDVASLKAYAAETAPVVQRHYEAAKSLHESLK